MRADRGIGIEIDVNNRTSFQLGFDRALHGPSRKTNSWSVRLNTRFYFPQTPTLEIIMRNILFFAVAAALSAGSLHAQSMPASVFLAKATALQKKGAMALFTRDFRLLRKEIEQSSADLDADQASAARAGHKPEYCKPNNGSINSTELLNYLSALPVDQAALPIKSALKGLLVKKFRC